MSQARIRKVSFRNSAPSPEREEASLGTGRVIRVENGHVTLMAKGFSLQAAVAASCLLAPEPNDEVLFAPLPDGRAFILAILTREDKKEARLRFPDGLSIESPRAVRIASRTALSLDAPESGITAATLKVEAAEMHAKAALCTVLAQTIRTAGDRLESCFARLFSRLGSSRRIIVDHDETQAGSSRLAVSDTALVQAKTVTHTAADMVRIDAPQVHVS